MASVPGLQTYFTAPNAPNPAFVEMFATEKGIDLMSKAFILDITALADDGKPAHRTGEYAIKNPAGGTPYMEFDNGSVISETVALCELLDNYGDGAKLCGFSPMEKAKIGMWLRRIEQHIVLPLFAYLRWGPARKFFADKGLHGMLANKEAATQQLAVAHSQVLWLDDLMCKAGKPEFLCGSNLSICDCMLFIMLEFFNPVVKKAIKDEWFKQCEYLPEWFARMEARPSSKSLQKNMALKPTAKL